MDKSKVVVLCTFPTTGEALIYKTLLEGSGIRAALLNETMSEVLPLQSELVEVRLAVLEKDKEKAEKILKAKFDKEEFKAETK